jgi:hypothetical protein
VVWASTWVPTESPIEGFGAGGYAVAWVDLGDGSRRQLLVSGDRAPAPLTHGSIRTAQLGDETVELFFAEGAAT